MSHHLLGGNVYDRNTHEIRIAPRHPAIRQLQDRWPRDDAGGMNMPVKPTEGDPANPVEALLYFNRVEGAL